MKLEEKVFFTDGTMHGEVSVAKETYAVSEQGKTLIIRERRTFNPTEQEELSKFAPELSNFFTAMWTKEVVESWLKYTESIVNF